MVIIALVIEWRVDEESVAIVPELLIVVEKIRFALSPGIRLKLLKEVYGSQVAFNSVIRTGRE